MVGMIECDKPAIAADWPFLRSVGARQSSRPIANPTGRALRRSSLVSSAGRGERQARWRNQASGAAGLMSGCRRRSTAVIDCLWGIRGEVWVEAASVLVSESHWLDCKSVAKATKVRILHLPPSGPKRP